MTGSGKSPEGALKELRAKSQAALIQFLQADLDLAFGLLCTARIEADLDPPRRTAILAKVKAALVAIRQFEGRIEDRASLEAIHARANELDAALKAETA